MPTRYPRVVFAPRDGKTFVVEFDETSASRALTTPMPETRGDGKLDAAWRWGGHHVDQDARTVHFTFVNRLTNTAWTADVAFE